MNRWFQYIKERFPLPVYMLLGCGYAFSGIACALWPLPVMEVFMATVLLLVFLFELRIMDEYKDREKDKIAHPTRPIPRGLFSEQEVARFIAYGLITMALLVLGLAFAGYVVTSALYCVVTIYLFLMYKEFFVGHWLGKRPFLYAITHQPIGALLALAATALVAPHTVFTQTPVSYAVTTLGGFFAYEVARKLNPNAHPLLQTYVVVAGHKKTFVAFFISLATAIAGLFLMGMPGWILALPIFTACSFLILFWKPHFYKAVEGITTFNLIVCVWAGVILHYLK